VRNMAHDTVANSLLTTPLANSATVQSSHPMTDKADVRPADAALDTCRDFGSVVLGQIHSSELLRW